MIDIATEKVITLDDAAKLLGVTRAAVDKYRKTGVGGRRLEFCWVGGSVKTSVEACKRFIRHPDETPVVSYETASCLAARERLAERRNRKRTKESTGTNGKGKAKDVPAR